ncbi:hypothetical protein BH23BAC1_BH23BAC1_28330 [soil metagenome]
MNREYDYSELIEDYLTGNLSPKQKMEFEAQLERDPDLNRDFLLQKDIITAIKDVRKAELKSMLNNVNVSSTNGFNYFPLQVVSAIVATSILAVGTYYYFSDNSEAAMDSSPTPVETTADSNPVIFEESSEIANSSAVGEENIPSVEEQLITENSSEQEAIVENPEESTVEELAGSIVEESKDPVVSETPAGNSGNVEANRPDLNVETKTDRNHAFHYQYYEDKLFLYGDFKGSAYEVLKLPTPNGVKLYMSYDGRFYKMERSRRIRPFELLEDPVIIEQLQKLKTK